MIGAIADDLTGAVDLAGALVQRGYRTRLHVGVPSGTPDVSGAEAIVVALKSRSEAPAVARQQTAAAHAALRRAGCTRAYVKYCSTFDSTSEGNIGPACDAVLEQTQAPIAVVVPSFPANGRTMYQGHLFVHGQLLHESPMSRHPLTPMRDSDIVRVMQQQTPHPVGLLRFETVRRGPRAVRSALDELAAGGHRYAVVDVLGDQDLESIGAATADDPLVTAGSGLALGLPRLRQDDAAAPAPRHTLDGPDLILAGSASQATRRQITAAHHLPQQALDAQALATTPEAVTEAAAELADWVRSVWVQAAGQNLPAPTALIHSGVPPEGVEASSSSGRAQAAAVETVLALVARELRHEVRRLIIAGGETSGAVIRGLGIADLAIGPLISPGISWCFAVPEGGSRPIAIAPKSGNFGATDFFTSAREDLM